MEIVADNRWEIEFHCISLGRVNVSLQAPKALLNLSEMRYFLGYVNTRFDYDLRCANNQFRSAYRYAMTMIVQTVQRKIEINFLSASEVSRKASTTLGW